MANSLKGDQKWLNICRRTGEHEIPRLTHLQPQTPILGRDPSPRSVARQKQKPKKGTQQQCSNPQCLYKGCWYLKGGPGGGGGGLKTGKFHNKETWDRPPDKSGGECYNYMPLDLSFRERSSEQLIHPPQPLVLVCRDLGKCFDFGCRNQTVGSDPPSSRRKGNPALRGLRVTAFLCGPPSAF